MRYVLALLACCHSGQQSAVNAGPQQQRLAQLGANEWELGYSRIGLIVGPPPPLPTKPCAHCTERSMTMTAQYGTSRAADNRHDEAHA